MERIEEGVTLAICDAGPLIHLDEVGCLDVLVDFAEILVPETVWREVLKHRPAALEHPDLALQRVRPVGPVPPALTVLAQNMTIHAGEWEALRVALEHKQGLMLSDDGVARIAARSLGIPFHGTLGILLRAVRNRQRTRKEVLDISIHCPAILPCTSSARYWTD